MLFPVQCSESGQFRIVIICAIVADSRPKRGTLYGLTCGIQLMQHSAWLYNVKVIMRRYLLLGFLLLGIYVETLWAAQGRGNHEPQSKQRHKEQSGLSYQPEERHSEFLKGKSKETFFFNILSTFAYVIACLSSRSTPHRRRNLWLIITDL